MPEQGINNYSSFLKEVGEQHSSTQLIVNGYATQEVTILKPYWERTYTLQAGGGYIIISLSSMDHQPTSSVQRELDKIIQSVEITSIAPSLSDSTFKNMSFSVGEPKLVPAVIKTAQEYSDDLIKIKNPLPKC